MSSTIRTTIQSTVEGYGTIPMGYQRVVDGVVEAVEGLAAQAADSLRESGRALGASSEQIEAALVSAGLVEEEDVDIATPDDDDRIGKVEASVATLTDLVTRLTALAERHLGRI
jgi:hypothetical protein